MQETHNNCLESKKCNTTFHQVKTGKHECRTTIILSRKNVTRPFFRRKQVSMSGEIRCYYISALMLTCFCLTKDCVLFFRLETIVASFLHLMVLK